LNATCQPTLNKLAGNRVRRFASVDCREKLNNGLAGFGFCVDQIFTAPGFLRHAFFDKISFVRFFVQYLSVKPTKIIANVGDLISLGIEVLYVVNDVVQLINQAALPALNVA
jgi:hypothetical protein